MNPLINTKFAPLKILYAVDKKYRNYPLPNFPRALYRENDYDFRNDCRGVREQNCIFDKHYFWRFLSKKKITIPTSARIGK